MGRKEGHDANQVTSICINLPAAVENDVIHYCPLDIYLPMFTVRVPDDDIASLL